MEFGQGSQVNVPIAVLIWLRICPMMLKVDFGSGPTYLLMRWFKVPHNVASPGALIGASNFFELAVAVAVAITLFGPGSPAALATVVGVLVEVPVMLMGLARHWGHPLACDN